jgi:hypothetical protein
MRRTRGEHRWPSALAAVVAIGLQLVLPNRVVPQAGYLLPVLEGALLVGLIVVNPFRIDRESALLRTVGLALTVLVGLSNGWSVVLRVRYLVSGGPSSPAELVRKYSRGRAGFGPGVAPAEPGWGKAGPKITTEPQVTA